MTAIHIYRIADGRLAEHWVNRDQRRRLATPRRRDDLGRAIGQRRGRALLGVERGEDGFMDHHATMIAGGDYRPISGGLPTSLLGIERCEWAQGCPAAADGAIVIGG